MKILNNEKPMEIVIIGAGANGSHFFRNLLQDIAVYSLGNKKVKETTVMIVDGDRVEKHNLSNQLFDADDINSYKVQALCDRYGTHYNKDCLAVSEYITTLDELKALYRNSDKLLPVLIGAVDNNRTRMLMHEFFHDESIPELLYIDVGVEGVILDSELKGDPERFKKIQSSGFSGQVVVGYKEGGQVFLAPVADLYPTILTDEESVFPTQTCGVDVINNPQRCETNKMAAQMTNIVLNNLFFTGEILQEEIIFNARFGTSQARFIPNRIEQAYTNFFKESVNNGTLSIVS